MTARTKSIEYAGLTFKHHIAIKRPIAFMQRLVFLKLTLGNIAKNGKDVNPKRWARIFYHYFIPLCSIKGATASVAAILGLLVLVDVFAP